jgi:hypothetical protein
MVPSERRVGSLQRFGGVWHLEVPVFNRKVALGNSCGTGGKLVLKVGKKLDRGPLFS